mmetsp:Transcript_5608/g.9677  ORF Transcript_5608/g.9677 Transcript_5608/m.9677 type:complete len:399 (-) Transcript_5608:59-1255(-)|eukprot:CAMPEP_0198211284 /NCGR_PEP_ID=MMETSP1445-20131203/22985_1 /TAXON_ID=36898 /ORGANISM="Pyramimonas sp., Strain CCMP2087" /LENGTH=398 /DNA_ID=CAMNT_0043885505 /DNA_START=175 /DNA_END=1371 /DNA_ORIENTATION=+
MPPKKGEEEQAPTGAARFGRVKNNLKMGVVGLPNVGKSSLFNLLTEQSVAAENYPFCTIEPNEARCAVPDERYDYLCNMWDPPSKYPAYLGLTDIAGLVKGAAEGAGLGNAFLSHIQKVDGIFHVVRSFDNPEVCHVDDTIDPVRDLDTIQHELCQKDLAYVLSAVEQEKKDVKKNPTMKLSLTFTTVMEKVQALLEANKPVRDGEFSPPEVDMIINKLGHLITSKPVIYLVNLTEKDYIRKKNKHLLKIHTWIKEHGGGMMIPFSIEYEQNLWDARADPAATEALTAEAKSAMPKMIVQGYKELNLMYFFTAGEKEVRCWTVYNGALAPQAAGVIHTDFEKGFIKAEIVGFDDFKAVTTRKGMAEAKEAGKYRQEGKGYRVVDGDIIHFLFNPKGGK